MQGIDLEQTICVCFVGFNQKYVSRGESERSC